MAFEAIFYGPPDSNVSSVGSQQSPRLGVDVVNNFLYLNTGNGWVVANEGGISMVTPSQTNQQIDGGNF